MYYINYKDFKKMKELARARRLADNSKPVTIPKNSRKFEVSKPRVTPTSATQNTRNHSVQKIMSGLRHEMKKRKK